MHLKPGFQYKIIAGKLLWLFIIRRTGVLFKFSNF